MTKGVKELKAHSHHSLTGDSVEAVMEAAGHGHNDYKKRFPYWSSFRTKTTATRYLIAHGFLPITEDKWKKHSTVAWINVVKDERLCKKKDELTEPFYYVAITYTRDRK